MHTGERLRKLRKERNITVCELARDLGCSRQYIHLLEQAKKPISSTMVEKYCRYFDTSSDFIMGIYQDSSVIPVFHVGERERNKKGSMSLPAFFLNEEKEYFAITLENKSLIILERDTSLCFKKQGFFEYRGRYYFSSLEKYADGSIWLISQGNKPQPVEKEEHLKPRGYQSYQLS